MHTDLQAEKRALTKHWSKREKHINAVIENMAGMVGDVQAISGNALKDIPALELDPDEEQPAIGENIGRGSSHNELLGTLTGQI
jgi:hypothetical protein